MFPSAETIWFERVRRRLDERDEHDLPLSVRDATAARILAAILRSRARERDDLPRTDPPMDELLGELGEHLGIGPPPS